MNRIELKLLSDMCAASGEGYSHTIDTDVCYDEYGLPRIPSRRLKGCLRAAAEYIGSPHIDRIFGVSGKTEGTMKLGNGLLKDHAALVEEIKKDLAGVPPQDVLELFTGTRISTEINDETGVAKDESMRAVRVVNRLLPYGENESTVFVFDCDCPDGDKKELERICMALRRMGSNRNRGMGEVECRFITADASGENASGGASGQNAPRVTAEALGNGRARLDLELTFLAPVLLPAPDNYTCSRAVSGTAMLGALASLYLRSGGKADEIFERLFLNGEVSYGNFTAAGSIPAPACVGKLKSPDGTDDGRIVSRFRSSDRGEAKPLRDGFIDGSMNEVKVRTESVFHHNPGQDMLYTQEAVSAGQVFRGAVEGPEDLIKVLEGLLNGGTLRIGRSKTAQYARVDVKSAGPAPEEKPLTVKKGDLFAVSLVTDVILTDGQGLDITDPGKLREAVTAAFGITGKAERFTEVETLPVRLIHGYNAKRNMRNIPRSAFAMGGTLGFKALEDLTIPVSGIIGKRTAEGFGRLKCVTEDQVNASLAGHTGQGGKQAGGTAPKIGGGPLAQCYREKHREDELARKALAFYRNSEACKAFGRDDITLSFIGRIMLMADQAKDEDDMARRLDSVKDDGKKKAAKKLFEAVRAEYPDDWKGVMANVLRLCRYGKKSEGHQEGGGGNG